MKIALEVFSLIVAFLAVHTNAQLVSNISPNGVGVDEQHVSGTLSVDLDYDERNLATQAISSNARERQWPLVNEGVLGIAIVKVVMRRNGASVVSRLYDEQLYTDVHGYYEEDSNTVASQFNSCSFGNLTVEADSTNRIIHEVNLPGTVDDYIAPGGAVRWDLFYSNIEEELDQTTNVTMNSNITNIIVVVPIDVQLGNRDGMPIDVMSKKYLILDDFSWNLFNLMHGLGRQIGLSLSGDVNQETYGDATGYMGRQANPSLPPLSQPLGFRRCFNAAKSWQLGWYSDKSVELDLTTKAESFKISPVYNYNFPRESNIVTIARIKLPSMPYDFYMMYNRAEEFNEHTSDYINGLTIVKGAKNFQSSFVERALYIYPTVWYNDQVELMNFDTSGRKLRIKLKGFKNERPFNPRYLKVEVKVIG